MALPVYRPSRSPPTASGPVHPLPNPQPRAVQVALALLPAGLEAYSTVEVTAGFQSGARLLQSTRGLAPCDGSRTSEAKGNGDEPGGGERTRDAAARRV